MSYASSGPGISVGTYAQAYEALKASMRRHDCLARWSIPDQCWKVSYELDNCDCNECGDECESDGLTGGDHASHDN